MANVWWKVTEGRGTNEKVWKRCEPEWAKEVVTSLMKIMVSGPITIERVDEPEKKPEPEVRYACPSCSYWSYEKRNVQRHAAAAHHPRKPRSKKAKA